jgi:hypothetical protein
MSSELQIFAKHLVAGTAGALLFSLTIAGCAAPSAPSDNPAEPIRIVVFPVEKRPEVSVVALANPVALLWEVMHADMIDAPFGCNTYISGVSIEVVRQVAIEVDEHLASSVTAGDDSTECEEPFDRISIVPARSMHDLVEGWTAEVSQFSYNLGTRRVTYDAEFDGSKWTVEMRYLHASNIGVLQEDESDVVPVDPTSTKKK